MSFKISILHMVLFLYKNSYVSCKDINDIALHAFRFEQLEE